jgi:hypothetical protein
MSDERPVLLDRIHTLLRGPIRPARSIRFANFAAWLALGAALLTAGATHAQVGIPGPHSPFPQPIGQSAGGDLDDGRQPNEIDAARRARALNDMRQKEIVSDTNKLLKLASELDAEIHKANPDALTPDQLHKLATIAKLAHNVKEHMSIPLGGMPVYQTPPPSVMH